jgi:hypothetical protein
MSTKLIAMAVLMATSLANAAGPKMDDVTKTAKPHVVDTSIKDGKNDATVAKAGGSTSSKIALEKVSAIVDDVASKDKTIKINKGVLEEFTKASSGNPATKELAALMGQYLSSFVDAGETKTIKTFAKIMDLASREDVGVNNAKYQDLLGKLMRKTYELKSGTAAVEAVLGQNTGEKIDESKMTLADKIDTCE